MPHTNLIHKSKQGDLVIKFFGTIYQTELSNEYAMLDSITIGLNVGFGNTHTIAEVDLKDPIAKARFVEMLPYPAFDTADQAEAFDRTFDEHYMEKVV